MNNPKLLIIWLQVIFVIFLSCSSTNSSRTNEAEQSRRIASSIKNSSDEKLLEDYYNLQDEIEEYEYELDRLLNSSIPPGARGSSIMVGINSSLISKYRKELKRLKPIRTKMYVELKKRDIQP